MDKVENHRDEAEGGWGESMCTETRGPTGVSRAKGSGVGRLKEGHGEDLEGQKRRRL